MTITISNPSGILTTTAKVDESGVSPLASGHGFGNVFQGENLFLDISKTIYFRKSDYTQYDAADLDAKGFPARIPAGSTNITAHIYANADAGALGDYLVRWTCDVELAVTGGSGAAVSNAVQVGTSGTADLTLTGDGPVLFSLVGGGSGDTPNFSLQILPKRTFPNAGGLTGVQLSDAGRNWNPDYLDLWEIPDANGRPDRPFFFARYMDLNNVNRVTEERDVGDIKTLDHAYWIKEMPPALAVEFAQYAKPERTWWCFPKSTDAYQQAVMTILKDMVGHSVPVFENGNEKWNTRFDPTKVIWADAIEYFASQGVAGFFTAVGVTLTSGSRDVTVGAGEGANFTVGDAVSASGTFIGSVDSVASDVVTIDRDHNQPTGTYNVTTGPYDAWYDMHMMQLERIRTNAEAVFASTADFRTALTWRQTSSVKSNLVDTPYWVQVDPSRPAPFTRHDFYSVSTYYYGSLTEAMVETFQTDQAQAVADFHAEQMAGIASLSTTLSNLRAALDAINPSMPIWPYEGGMHTLDDTTDDDWRTVVSVSFTNGSNTITVAADSRVRVGASVTVNYGDGGSSSDFVTTITAVSGTTVTLQDSFTGTTGSYSTTFRVYDNDDAVPLVDAWRGNAAYQAEAQAAWWEAQKALDCACQYLMIKKTSGSGSWGLRQSMTEADEHGVKLLALAGQSLTASFGG